jgi:hypothetical protein
LGGIFTSGCAGLLSPEDKKMMGRATAAMVEAATWHRVGGAHCEKLVARAVPSAGKEYLGREASSRLAVPAYLPPRTRWWAAPSPSWSRPRLGAGWGEHTARFIARPPSSLVRKGRACGVDLGFGIFYPRVDLKATTLSGKRCRTTRGLVSEARRSCCTHEDSGPARVRRQPRCTTSSKYGRRAALNVVGGT